VLAETLAEIGYRVVEAPAPRRERGRGKTDAMDAVTAARNTLAMPVAHLRDRRGGQDQVALQVLTTAREQLNAERLRAINALTALARAHDLDIDARRALSSGQIRQVAGWRRRVEPLGTATARAEATRLAGRVAQLDADLKSNRDQLTVIVTARAPQLLAMPGVGAVTAAVVCACGPTPAGSAPPRARQGERSDAASSATRLARSTEPSTPQTSRTRSPRPLDST